MKKIFIIILLITPVLVLTQNENFNFPNFIPPTPEVAALGAYIDTPFTESSGVPNITIPFFELTGKELSIPISINYHSGGIKVNQMSSRVGLGWSLMAGGSISKTVRGIGDCQYNGFINPNKSLDEFNAMSQAEKNSYLENNQTSAVPNDFESDFYYFDFLNYSGKFYLKQVNSGNIVIIQVQKSDIKIIPIINESNNLEYWKAITPDGTIFYFGKSKNEDRTAINLAYSTGGVIPSLPDSNSNNYIESWKLMEVETSKGEIVSFHYDETSETNVAQVTRTDYIFKPQNRIRTYYSITNLIDKRITKIVSKKGYVEFEYDVNDRIDMNGDKALNKVSLFNYNDELIDSYVLNHSYFTTNDQSNYTFGYLNQKQNRLRLDGLSQVMPTETNKEYQFLYNSVELPNRDSYSQDYWGYFNGKSNSGLYPKVQYNKNNTSFTNPTGANRNVSTFHAKAGVLEKIIYPTGGSTIFNYESNTLSYNPGGTVFGFEPYLSDNIASFSSQYSPSHVWTEIYSIPANEFSNSFGNKLLSNYNQNCVNASDIECPRARIIIVDSNNNSTILKNIDFDDDNIPFNITNLSDGEILKIEVLKGDVSQNDIDIDFSLSGYRAPPGGFIVGGLRVGSIQYFDRENTIVKEKLYDYSQFLNPEISSGELINPSIYINLDGYREYDYNTCSIQTYDIIKSTSIFPLVQASHPVIYGEVTVSDGLSTQPSFKTEKKFSIANAAANGHFGIIFCDFNCSIDLTPLPSYNHRQGLLLSEKKYKRQGNSFFLVQELINVYNEPDTGGNAENIVFKTNLFQACGYGTIFEKNIISYFNLSERFLQSQRIKKDYFNNGTVETITNYTFDSGYNSNTFIKESETITNDPTTTLRTVTKYPEDISGEPHMSTLINEHRIGIPIEVETYNQNNTLINATKTEYGIFNGKLQPRFIKSKNENNPSGNYETRIKYNRYDALGNPQEISQENGMRITYLWGYNSQYPVAKIENCGYTQIPFTIRNAIETATSTTMANALQSLRSSTNSNLQNAMITTMLYEPLVGVTQITDPKGDVQFYKYDDFGRLEQVKDKDGNIVQENDYHYRN